jgi:twitching motility protein PilT
MLQEIIEQAASSDCSDILVKEGNPVWVRMRGDVVRAECPNVTETHIKELLQGIESQTMIPAEQVRQRLDQNNGDLDFAARIGSVRFRGNIYYTDGRKLALALRRLDDRAPALAKLGLPEAYVSKILAQSKGLILVTGATGSGKTTTLAATIEYLNDTKCGHIITLEDPVEYLLESRNCLVDQRQIGRDTDSFQNGLRAALREDPDILLIGELRDHATIQTALAAATTGHLVLGSLHTNSARQSIERLTSEFGNDRRDWVHTVLSQALLGCISQTLIPRADGEGRVLAAELLVCTSDVRTAIRDGKTTQIFNAMDTGTSKGQVLLNTTLKQMIRAGQITAEDALYASYDPANLKKELGLV